MQTADAAQGAADTTTQDTRVSTALAAYNATEAGLAELKDRLNGKVYGDITTTAVYKEISADRTECVQVCTGVEVLRKATKAPYIEAGKKIDAKAAEITVAARALANERQVLIDAEDARKEKIKEEKAAANALRLSNIRTRIAGFAHFIRMATDFDSLALQMHIAKIEAGHLVAADYAELLDEATAAKVDVLVTLNGQLASLVAKEANDKRLEDERVETERKASLQLRLDTIRRYSITAVSLQCIEALEELKASVGSTDLSGMLEYEGLAVEAINKAIEDITSMIDQKRAAKKLADDQAAFALVQKAAEEKQAAENVITSRLSELESLPLLAFQRGFTAEQIQLEIDDLAAAECNGIAALVIMVDKSLNSLRSLHAVKVKEESDAAQLKADQDKLLADQKEKADADALALVEKNRLEKVKADAEALELKETNRKAQEKADAKVKETNRKALAKAESEYNEKMEAATADHMTTLNSILSATIDDTLAAPAALQLIGHLVKLAIEKEEAA